MSIFKSYDIRGVWGDDLAADVVYRIGRGMSTMLRHRVERPAMVVGGDVRNSTEQVREALLKGLTDGGCDVADVGVVPTPVFYYACRTFDPDASAMITASHNPPEFNGLKVSVDRDPVTPEKIQDLCKVVGAGEFVDGRGSVQRQDVWEGYHRSLAEMFPGGFKLKVVADAGNGAWSSGVVETLERLGFDAVGLFCEPDGSFPNRPADPTKAKNIAALSEAVRREGAAIGVAFDGDGDRAVFVDESGEMVNPDKILVALARDALARCADPSKETVVHDSICSRLVPIAIKELGATAVMERVGYTFIRERVLRENALFGGELSGHFFYRELNANDDGMYSFLRCAQMLQDAGRPLSAILSDMPSFVVTPALRIAFGGAEGKEAIEAIAGGSGEVSRLDGVRVDYPDGWGLARMSATEPKITLRFEAETAARLRPIVEEFLAPAPGLLAKVAAELCELGFV